MDRTLGSDEFDNLVDEAIAQLPDALMSRINNLEIVVNADAPASVEDEQLLGLYEGIPLTERGTDYFGVLPDRITLFKANIEDEAFDRDDVREVVRVTVLHEIAHHFGIDDDRLEELGWA